MPIKKESTIRPSPVHSQVLTNLRQQTSWAMLPQAGLGPFLSAPLQFSVPHLQEIQIQG